MWCFLSIVIFCKLSFILSQSLPLLLFVSFDGFRFDYPKIHGPLANFSRLKQRGVYAPSMIPTFNTAASPNQYTLITGLYEEVHGLIAEQIYDPKSKNIFQSWENMTNQWWPIKSIWTINEQRSGARSGVIGWTQNSMDISKSEAYQNDRSDRDMIDRILQWFTDPNEPINFGAIFFPEPALTGRRTGPCSNATRDVLRKCDQSLGYLLNRIEQDIKLRNNLHLIVTSTHGMEPINATNTPMYLEHYVDINRIKVFGSETVWNVFVNAANDISEVWKNLTKIPNSKTYRRENIPEQYHYKNNPRIGDLVIMLNPGYELHRQSFHGGLRVDWNSTHGNAGYDNQRNSMKTIFYANGPQLKENFTLSNASSSLYNVDLFPLMCLILNIDRCPSSNGSLTNIQSFLVDPQRVLNIMEKETEKLHDGPMGLVIYLLVLVSFVLILIMAVVWTAVSFRNASAMARAAHPDAATIAELNQYKFTQINEFRLNPVIGDDNL